MGWKVTATKLFCDTVKEWVTIMVYHDGTTKCGYYERHFPEEGSTKSREEQCHEKCTILAAYKEDVFQRDEKAE
jgi:Zn ribbon nucleic-acid-binding protein